MCAALESQLSTEEQATVAGAIAEKVDGKFEFFLFREGDSEFDSDSD